MADKVFEGSVHSNKMSKTVVVSVVSRLRDRSTGKTMTRRKKYKVHSEESATLNPGDWVSFTPCRPISKEKRFRLLKVLKKAEQATQSSLDEA